MFNQDLSKLGPNKPIHSYLVCYSFAFAGRQVLGSFEAHLERPIRAFDGKAIRTAVTEHSKSAPADIDKIVITNLVPLGVLPNSVFQQLKQESEQ